MRGIIPACGYGTRVGMEPNQSKEMLWNKDAGYLIDYSIKLCNDYGITPLIITRKEKTDLIQYVEDKAELLIMEPGKEWADTVWKSKEAWGDYNILLLPDARWSSEAEILKQLKYHASSRLNLTIATHTIEDPSKWCVVSANNTALIEKPQDAAKGVWEAFGVLGFSKWYGEELFYDLVNHGWSRIPRETQFLKLYKFEDVTREKSEDWVYINGQN